jgi:hypothetical protein
MLFTAPCQGYPIVVATHMRSGTHLTIDLLRRQFPDVGGLKWPGEANDSVYLALDVLSGLQADWGESRGFRILRRSRHPICKVHWTEPDLSDLAKLNPELASWINGKGRFIYVIRNPKKVMASMLAWEMSVEGGDSLAGDLESWIVPKLRYWSAHVIRWIERPGIMVLRFEDIVKTPEAVIGDVARHLDLEPLLRKPLLPPKLRGRWHSRLNRLFAVRPASTEILTQVPAAAALARIDTLADDLWEAHAGEVCRRFGYQ